MTTMDWHAFAIEYPGLLLLGVFLTAFAESLALVGIVVPGVVVLVVFAGIAQLADISVWALMGVGFGGALAGDVLSFYWGVRRRDGIWEAAYLRRYRPWLLRGTAFFERWGWASIFVGRFVGPVRPVVPVVAGVLGMPARRFWLVDLLACICWAPVYLLPGYWAGQIVSVLPSISWPLLILGACWCATLGALVLFLFDAKRLMLLHRFSGAMLFGLAVIILGTVARWWPVRGVHAAIEQSRVQRLDQFMQFVTQLGDALVLVPFVVSVSFILAWRFTAAMAGQWLCQILLGLLFITGLKVLLQFPRPENVVMPDPAFPSGHAWMALLIWLGLILWIPWPRGRARQTLISVGGVIAVSVAYSRLYLGVHWWPDVMAGILGALIQSLIAWQAVPWRYDSTRVRPPLFSGGLQVWARQIGGLRNSALAHCVNSGAVLVGDSARNLALLIGWAWLVAIALGCGFDAVLQ